MRAKELVKRPLAALVFHCYRMGLFKMKQNIRVMTIDDTIEELLGSEKSLVRFGDGEIVLIRGRGLSFQRPDPVLSRRLRKILAFSDDGLLVAIQEIFGDLRDFIPKSRRFWMDHLLTSRAIYEACCNPERIYRSARFSRCYATVADKSRCKERFDKIRRIWADRDIVVVEGTASGNGKDNDLLSLARSIERVTGPEREAFDDYDRILDQCKSFPKDRLFLLSLGPCAKLLAQDLYREGYRVIDIGNINREYEWYLHGITDKDEGR